MAKLIAKGALRTRLWTIIRGRMRVGSGGKNCRTRRGQIAIVVHVSKTSNDFLFVKDIQNGDSPNYISKILWKGSDYGHCCKFIHQENRAELVYPVGVDNPQKSCK